MNASIIHQCECPTCHQEEDHPEKIQHHRMNIFFSRLNEQQKRWYAALEAEKAGWGGQTLVSQITGLSVPTIQRGREELSGELADRPQERVRIPGGGRKVAEKKTPC
jgi:hypothetical protein